MNPSFNVLVVQQNGWWSVLSPELDISGFGETETAAKEAFERSLLSTVMANLRGSLSESASEPIEGHLDFKPSQPGQVVRKTRVSMGAVRSADSPESGCEVTESAA